MTTWPAPTLTAIASTDDLHVAPFRPDGASYGTPTWIWSVVVDGELYVRAYNGTASRWYQAALAKAVGRIRAAGSDHEVSFTAVDRDAAIEDEIDGAYRDRYAGSPYLGAMISARARAATVQITPRGDV
jgi:hypothetical protein